MIKSKHVKTWSTFTMSVFCYIINTSSSGFLKNHHSYSKDFFLSNDMHIIDDGYFWTFRLPGTRVIRLRLNCPVPQSYVLTGGIRGYTPLTLHTFYQNNDAFTVAGSAISCKTFIARARIAAGVVCTYSVHITIITRSTFIDIWPKKYNVNFLL